MHGARAVTAEAGGDFRLRGLPPHCFHQVVRLDLAIADRDAEPFQERVIAHYAFVKAAFILQHEGLAVNSEGVPNWQAEGDA